MRGIRLAARDRFVVFSQVCVSKVQVHDLRRGRVSRCYAPATDIFHIGPLADAAIRNANAIIAPDSSCHTARSRRDQVSSRCRAFCSRSCSIRLCRIESLLIRARVNRTFSRTILSFPIFPSFRDGRSNLLTRNEEVRLLTRYGERCLAKPQSAIRLAAALIESAMVARIIANRRRNDAFWVTKDSAGFRFNCSNGRRIDISPTSSCRSPARRESPMGISRSNVRHEFQASVIANSIS